MPAAAENAQAGRAAAPRAPLSALLPGRLCSRLRRDPLAAQERLGREEAGWAMLPGSAWDG